VRTLEGGRVAKGVGIEDDHVGEIAFAQVAAMLKSEDIGGQTRGAVNRRRSERRSARCVAADLAREAAVSFADAAPWRPAHRSSVAGGGHERLLHDPPHLFLCIPKFHHLAPRLFDLHTRSTTVQFRWRASASQVSALNVRS